MSGSTEPAGHIWSVLEHSRQVDFPPLLYRCIAHETHLTLLVSDIIRVWDGSMSHPDILAQAVLQSSPIDPSESRGQFKALTMRLLQSLKGGFNILASGQDKQQQSLYIRSSLKLPAPLKSLQWTFKLAEVDAPTFARFITFPSLHEVHSRQTEVQSLVGIVKQKDHVISRLLDQIENSSIDLGIIFPGVVGLKSRKQSVRTSEAAKHVPGLVVFEQTRWAETLQKSASSDYAHRSNLSFVYPLISATDVVQSSPGWTSELPSADALGSLGESEKSGVASRSAYRNEAVSTGRDNTDTTDSHDFEYLGSRPARNGRLPQISSNSVHSSVSDSDFDHSTNIKTTKPNNLRHIGPNGQIEKTRTDRSSAPTPNPNPRPPSPRLPGFGYASASSSTSKSNSDSELDKSPPKPSQSSTQPKRKLGQIGGKAKSQPSQSALSSQHAPSSVPNTPTPRKLGILGGKTKSSVSPSPGKSSFHTAIHTPSSSRLKPPLGKLSNKDSDATPSSRSVSPLPPPKFRDEDNTPSPPSTPADEKRAEPKRPLDPNPSGPKKKKKRRF